VNARDLRQQAQAAESRAESRSVQTRYPKAFEHAERCHYVGCAEEPRFVLRTYNQPWVGACDSHLPVMVQVMMDYGAGTVRVSKWSKGDGK
jgi:hypothetical protein